MVFHVHRGARLKVVSIEAPNGRLVDGHRYLALERCRFRSHNLQILEVFDNNKGLSCRNTKDGVKRKERKASTRVT